MEGEWSDVNVQAHTYLYADDLTALRYLDNPQPGGGVEEVMAATDDYAAHNRLRFAPAKDAVVAVGATEAGTLKWAGAKGECKDVEAAVMLGELIERDLYKGEEHLERTVAKAEAAAQAIAWVGAYKGSKGHKGGQPHRHCRGDSGGDIGERGGDTNPDSKTAP